MAKKVKLTILGDGNEEMGSITHRLPQHENEESSFPRDFLMDVYFLFKKYNSGNFSEAQWLAERILAVLKKEK